MLSDSAIEGIEIHIVSTPQQLKFVAGTAMTGIGAVLIF
jgi:hypothetical protein